MRRILRRARVACALLAVSAPIAGLSTGHAPGAASASGRPSTVAVVERDFQITAPRVVSAGSVDVVVTNQGPDMHELIVVRHGSGPLPMDKDGLTVDEDVLKPVTAGSLEPAEPGRPRTLRLHLRPGHYVLFCNMSGHELGGMDTDLVVR
jgi:uncharacterized cupredoxin-like copper-binding protein